MAAPRRRSGSGRRGRSVAMGDQLHTRPARARPGQRRRGFLAGHRGPAGGQRGRRALAGRPRNRRARTGFRLARAARRTAGAVVSVLLDRTRALGRGPSTRRLRPNRSDDLVFRPSGAGCSCGRATPVRHPGGGPGGRMPRRSVRAEHSHRRGRPLDGPCRPRHARRRGSLGRSRGGHLEPELELRSRLGTGVLRRLRVRSRCDADGLYYRLLWDLGP